MVTEDFELVDSKSVVGVQAADIMASGTCTLLSGEFKRSHEMALLLGANMLSVLKDEAQVNLISLAQAAHVSSKMTQVLEITARTSKPLI
jgi:hypothetical protein